MIKFSGPVKDASVEMVKEGTYEGYFRVVTFDGEFQIDYNRVSSAFEVSPEDELFLVKTKDFDEDAWFHGTLKNFGTDKFENIEFSFVNDDETMHLSIIMPRGVYSQMKERLQVGKRYSFQLTDNKPAFEMFIEQNK